MFDFTTETFSSLISIFSAVIGLSYPVLLQSIQRIDEQYQSVRLSRRFQKETIFKIFQIILLVNIIISLLAPYIIYITQTTSTIYIISLQTVLVAALLMTSFHLFTIIRIYYHPFSLLERLVKFLDKENTNMMKILEKEDNNSFVKDLRNVFDISVYSAKNNDRDLYFSALSTIYGYFYKYQKNTSADVPVVYPAGFVKILLEIKKLSSDKINPTYFYKENSITSVLYDTTYENIISESTYNIIWSILNDIINSDNKNWFKQYWSWADQYCNFVLNSTIKEDGGVNKDKGKERFSEFHIVLGALLVYNHKYDWLCDIMCFTNCLPPKYNLIPGTFIDIFDWFKKLDSMSSYRSFRLISTSYPFNGMNADVNTDYYIGNEIVKYLSLLMIRLFVFDDYNINYCDPKDLPKIGEGIKENEYYVELIKKLIQGVNNWYDKGLINKINFIIDEIPRKDSVIQLLDSYIKTCKSSIEQIETNAKIDNEKVVILKKDLLKFEQLYKRSIIAKGNANIDAIINGSKGNEKYEEVPYTYKLSKEDILEGYSSISSNLEEVLIRIIYNILQRYYLMYFVKNKSKQDYVIGHKDIFKCFNALQINNEENVILSLGIYLRSFENLYGKQAGLEITQDQITYKKIPIIDLASQELSFIILNRSDLPFWEFTKNSETALSAIDSNSYLYTNLDHIDSQKRLLKLSYFMKFHYIENVRYIRVKVSYNLPLDNNGDLDKIQPFAKI